MSLIGAEDGKCSFALSGAFQRFEKELNRFYSEERAA